MESKISNCIRTYIKEYYKGGLVGISDLAEHCDVIEGKVYRILVEMQSNQEIKLIKRYFCPHFHYLRSVGNQTTYCESCEFKYPNDQLELEVYIQPLKTDFSINE
jgi:hypothetical protein